MRRVLVVLGGLALLGSTAADLRAQTRFGVQASFGSDDVNFGIGGRATFNLRSLIKTPGFEGIASFDYFFPDAPAGVDVTYWEINGNLGYAIPNVKGSVAPYVGGGLNIAHASASSGGVSGSDTKVGLNLLGGIKFKSRTSRLAPFVEARIELSGGEIFVLTGGVVF